jgi:S1-C subfamily serine protease
VPLWWLALAALLVAVNPSAAAPDKKPDPRLFRRVLRSTVWVVVLKGPVPKRGKIEFGTGTGWVLDPQRRLVVTNRHVVREQKRVRVFFPAFVDGRLADEPNFYKQQIPRGGGIPGEVLATEVRRDLALVRLEMMPAGAAALPLAALSPQPGQRVHSLGNPGASPKMWRFATWTIRDVGPMRIMSRQHDKTVFMLETTVIQSVFLPELPESGGPGASGGPLVNGRGELVGVTQGQTQKNGKKSGFFVAVTAVKEFLRDQHVSLKQAPSQRAVAGAKKPAPRPKPAPPKEEDPKARKEKLAAVRLQLAHILEISGKKDKARKRYQDIIADFPHTDAAKTARERLAKLKP